MFLVITVQVYVEPNNDVCLIPESLALTVIFPKSNTSSDGSCVCSLWFRIQQCSCLHENNFFEVYNEGQSVNAKICWKNLKNHTIIHFVLIILNNEDILNPIPFPLTNQDFLESYEIIFQGELLEL